MRGRDVMAAVDTTRRPGRRAAVVRSNEGSGTGSAPAPLLRSLALHRVATDRRADRRAGEADAAGASGKRRQSIEPFSGS